MTQLSEWERFKQNPDKYAADVASSLPEQSAEDRAVRPWDFFNPNTEYASKEEAARRLDICRTCPFVIKATLQCKKCGCFMKAKTLLADATCPVGNW